MKSTHSPEGRARRSSCRRAALVLVAVALVGGADAQTPIDPSELVAPAVEVSGGNVNLTVRASVAGRRYQLQSTESLVPDSWANVGEERTGDGNDLLIATPRDPTVPTRLYRLALDPFPQTPEGFALIPAGSFQMGDAFAEGRSDERPVHAVNVSAFYMAKHETTKALWDEARVWGLNNGYTDLPTGTEGFPSKGANHPVHSVSWYDIMKWCNACSQKEGLTPCYTVGGAVYKTGASTPDCNFAASGYRLPTEAEWEKAARGGLSGKRFPWGDTITHGQANYHSSSVFAYDTSASRQYHPAYNDGTQPFSAPVGSFAANGYGLYDMAGNMWEWCWDWYESAYYAASPGSDPRGPSSGSHRVNRGGAWLGGAYYCRTAIRNGLIPSSRGNAVGFRTARSSVPQ